MSAPVKSSQNARALLDRLVKLTSTIPGLDGSLMIFQYSSPVIVALLLRLAKIRQSSSAKDAAGLVGVAAGVTKAAASVSDARVIMRAFGLLPVIKYLLALYPRPIQSLVKLLTFQTRPSLFSPKALPTMQLLALLGYYPLEHIAWLASKGVLPLAPATAGKAMLWGVRFWALYVLLELEKLRNTYISLNARTRSVRAKARAAAQVKEAEGYELQEASTEKGEGASVQPPLNTNPLAEVAALKKDWTQWKGTAIVNGAYAPLTLHWSTPGGLWQSPYVTAVFGCTAAVGNLMAEWRKGAAA